MNKQNDDNEWHHDAHYVNGLIGKDTDHLHVRSCWSIAVATVGIEVQHLRSQQVLGLRINFQQENLLFTLYKYILAAAVD